MLEEIKALEAAGRWADLLQLAESLPQGDALARVHLALSTRYENLATDGPGYRLALAHGQKALAAAVPGGLIHTWSLARVAAYLADFGRCHAAERAATAFLAALPHHPAAEAIAPWVRFHLGHVRNAQGKYLEAADLFRQTMAADAGQISERANLFLVWTLAEGGRVGDALVALPRSVSHVSPGHLSAAKAAVCAAAGDWAGARENALLAVRSYEAGEWQVYDIVQAAELCLILKRAALMQGLNREAAVWFYKSAAILFRWNAGLMLCLVPTLRGEGGEQFAHAASSCGPAGHHRTGLRGVLG